MSIMGFNTAPHAMRPPPRCLEGDDAFFVCGQYPRTRKTLAGVIQIPRDGQKVVSNALGSGGPCGDGFEDITVLCVSDQPGWDEDTHPTPADAQFRPFQHQGRLFIRLIGGRIGEIFDVDVLVNGTPYTVRVEVVYEDGTSLTGATGSSGGLF